MPMGMGRYRPPTIPGSKYITPEGYDRLQDELDYLWRVERPKITKSVQEAAAQGDRSENADYIYGKKRLREIDGRVRFLRGRLDRMVIAGSEPADPERIYFGAWVELEGEDGEVNRYRIVGPDEIDPKLGYISMDSPVAKLLMKKTVDDEIVVVTPKGETELLIKAVQYEPFE